MDFLQKNDYIVNMNEDNKGIAPYIPLEYVNSDDAFVIDLGVKETIKGLYASVLTIGLALAKIKSRGLHRDLGYKHMSRYIDSIYNETKMNRSSLYRLLRIGEAYTKYQAELEKIGFSESDGPSKLRYLEQALGKREKDEVYNNIMKMSVREFIDFACTAKAEITNDTPFMEIRGNTILIQGKKAVIVNKGLGRNNSELLMETVRIVSRALEKGGVVVAVHLRSRQEADRFVIEAERIREELQKKKTA